MQCRECSTQEVGRFFGKEGEQRRPIRGLCRRCYDLDLKSRNPSYRERQTANHRKWLEDPRNRERARESERKRSAARSKDPGYRAAGKYRRIKANYGLDRDTYERLVSLGCGICGSTKRPHVDHCHTTGQVRGLLCHSCNIGLGFLERPDGWAERALAYVRRAQDARDDG